MEKDLRVIQCHSRKWFLNFSDFSDGSRRDLAQIDNSNPKYVEVTNFIDLSKKALSKEEKAEQYLRGRFGE